VWQCLTAPIENLRNRAERLAPQLAKAEAIASAVPMETRSPIAAALIDGGWPSFGVALAPADGDLKGLERRLINSTQPVVGRVENERLVLDLRTVFPRQDKLLVESLTASTATADLTQSG
jgi:L-seryl-tRNA(Ser) seleniumtransferase